MAKKCPSLRETLSQFNRCLVRLGRNPTLENARKAQLANKTAWYEIYGEYFMSGEIPFDVMHQYLLNSQECISALHQVKEEDAYSLTFGKGKYVPKLINNVQRRLQSAIFLKEYGIEYIIQHLEEER